MVTYGAAVGVRDKGQQHQPTLHLLRAIQHRAIVLEVVIHGAVLSVGIRGRRHQQVVPLLRVARRHAVGPVGIAYGAAVGACEDGQQHQQAIHPLRARQCHAIVSAEVTYRAAISVGKGGPAAPAGLTSLTCDAALYHLVGYGHLQCGLQRLEQGQRQQQCLHLLRAMRRYAIVRDVVTYRAAIGACEGASSIRRRQIS